MRLTDPDDIWSDLDWERSPHTLWPARPANRVGELGQKGGTVPEYHPPPRVEAYLTLPPGAVVARDLEDECDCGCWDDCACPREDREDEYRFPRYGWDVKREVPRRFQAAFGAKAALAWGLADHSTIVHDAMKRVWTSEALEKQFYVANPFLDKLERVDLPGKVATIGLKKRSTEPNDELA